MWAFWNCSACGSHGMFIFVFRSNGSRQLLLLIRHVYHLLGKSGCRETLSSTISFFASRTKKRAWKYILTYVRYKLDTFDGYCLLQYFMLSALILFAFLCCVRFCNFSENRSSRATHIDVNRTHVRVINAKTWNWDRATVSEEKTCWQHLFIISLH